MIVPTIEHYKYFSEQQERKTVFSHSVLGKVFLISGYKSFKIENYPKNLSQMLQLSKKKFEEVHFFLDKIKNPILKADLMADYEAVAQYQMVYFFSDEDKSKYEHIKKKPMKLFLDLIANNPFEYINISLSHYIGLWSTGSKFIFLEKFLSKNNDINQPMKNEFDNSSGPMKSIDTKLLMVTQIFFIILFANIILLTVYFGFRLLMGKKINPIFFFLLILLQTYLALVSLTNIATIRYLMPLYPSIIILFLYSIKSLFLTFVNKG